MRVLVFGGGNMGFAMAEAFVKVEGIELTIIEKNESRTQELVQKGFNSFSDVKEVQLQNFELILFAVKPQVFSNLIKELNEPFSKNSLIVSVMAGISTESISSQTVCSKVIRLMPNLAVSKSEGVTGVYASDKVSNKEKEILDAVLKNTGLVVWVEQEHQINHITAISGSGPAYVFYFLNAMIKKAMEFGFAEKQAREMVFQTASGALSLARSNGKPLEEWISNVKSKGGTTEAALNVFAQNFIDEDLQKGIQAAANRSIELES